MSHEHLAQLIQARRDAIAADEGHITSHASILSILQVQDKREITEGQAIRLLG